MKVLIRWMIQSDFDSVLAIESASFEFPWAEHDFIRCLRQRNCIGMVAEHDERIVGFMVYELRKTQIHVEDFAVSPQFRRQGIGRRMVDKLVRKLSAQRRTKLILEVRETNLAAQLFFRRCGLRATCVLPGYEATGEDAYQFEYHYCGQHDLFLEMAQ